MITSKIYCTLITYIESCTAILNRVQTLFKNPSSYGRVTDKVIVLVSFLVSKPYTFDGRARWAPFKVLRV